MLKTCTVLLTLSLCSTAFADPISFTCDRPAWDSKVGCEATNTRETYVFHIDSNTLEADQIADKKSFRYSKPTYVYNRIRRCDTSGAIPYRGRFKTGDETITFWLVFHPGQYVEVSSKTQITLNLETMDATLKPAKNGSELNCVKSNDVSEEQFAQMMRNARDPNYMRPTSVVTATTR